MKHFLQKLRSLVTLFAVVTLGVAIIGSAPTYAQSPEADPPETGTTEVTATKLWVGGPAAHPDSTIQLYQNGAALGAPVNLPSGTTTHTWQDLAKVDSDGNLYNYTIDELNVPANYQKSVSGFTITNTYVSPKTNYTANVIWQGGSAPRPAVQIQLLQNGEAYGAPIEMPNGTTAHTWADLNETDPNGNAFVYTVAQITEPENYTTSISGSTITNTHQAPAENPAVENPECEIVDTENGVRLCKTAEPVDGVVNEWDVTLRVEADQTKKTSDTILVFDRSNSMNELNRLAHAKAAAIEFINTLLPNGNTTNRVALISFAGWYTEHLGFVTAANRQALINAINAITADGGTNTQIALHRAMLLMAGSTADLKNIVLLSDGYPTYSAGMANPDNYLIPYGSAEETGIGAPESQYQYGSGQRKGTGSSLRNCYEGWPTCNKYYNHGNSAIAEAGFVKAKGYTLYSVALSAGTEGEAVLRNIASPGKYYNANPNNLAEIFRQIAGSIAAAIQNVKIVDKMGQGIVVKQLVSGDTANAVISADKKTITWTPTLTVWDSTINKFVTTLTYRVHLDQDILTAQNENGLYPANENATITYDGNEDGEEFPVPKVNPVFVKIKKIVEGETCNNCTFHFQITLPNGTTETRIVKAGEEAVLYHAMPTGNYTIKEVKAFDENGQEINLNKYDIWINKSKYTLTHTSPDQQITATNKVKRTSVSVQKQWIGKPGEAVTVNLLANGSIQADIILNAGNNWSHTWGNLLAYSNSGQKINYTVEEVALAGYTTVISGNAASGFTITNTYEIPTKDLSVEKAWVNGETLRPGSIQVELLKDGVVHDTVTLDNSNSWKHSWSNLAATDINGTAYTYTVREKTAVPGFGTAVTGSEADGWVITNTYNVPTTDLNVEKAWENGETVRPDAIEVELLQNGVVYETVTLNAENNWKHQWTDLAKTADDGTAYTYTVREKTAVPGFGTAVTGSEADGWVITNTYVAPTIDTSVEKIWIGGPADKPSIEVELVRDGIVIDTVVLSKENGWRYEWKDIALTDENGNAYSFEVREKTTGIPYIASVDGTIGGGFIIKNTYFEPGKGGQEPKPEAPKAAEAPVKTLAKTGLAQDVITMVAVALIGAGLIPLVRRS